MVLLFLLYHILEMHPFQLNELELVLKYKLTEQSPCKHLLKQSLH